MRILGLDPGSRYTGYGVVDRFGSKLEPVEQGRITLPSKLPLAERLAKLHREIMGVLDRCEPEAVVLESLFRGVNVRSLIVLAQARGTLLATVAMAGLEVQEYSPAEIKSAVTGNGRADKDQIRRMVCLILGLKREKLSADASDALAAAICFAQRRRLDRLGREPKRVARVGVNR